MRLESESASRQYPAAPLSPLLHREAVEGVNRWLARFAPLLQPEGLDADRCRQWLQEIPTLREEGHQARETLEAQATQADLTLLTTLRQALRELDAQEAELRRRLGVLAPGDPEARVDLAQLQAQLAEAAARREVEEITGSSTTALGQRLELKTSPPSWAGAGFMGLFSAGWLTFTTLHALVMIRGTSQIFGFGALFLLLFYGIFWAVGLGMAWAAVMAASQETLTLEGDQLTLTRRLMAWRWARRFTVRRDSRAVLLPANVRQSGSNAMEVALYDGEGKEVRFASGRPLLEQEKLVERLNAHLSALRA